jgi:hypothetical protein
LFLPNILVLLQEHIPRHALGNANSINFRG